MNASPWAYKVSRKERESEIALCDRWIALYDILISLAAGGHIGAQLDVLSENQMVLLMAASPESAAAFGLSPQDAADMIAAYDYEDKWIPAWLRGLAPDYRKGVKLDASKIGIYGQDWLRPSAEWKKDRARFVAQRSAARRAIADGRAK